MKRIFRIFLYFLLIFCCFELLICFITPVYDFRRPEPFTGKKLYNPYEGMDKKAWRKANFHFHTRAWAGLTSGRDNTEEIFWETYKKLGYDVPCISNYQQISRFNKDSSFYIPTYEHGFGVRKKHQICIGAKKVLWFDFSLFQNLHQKQYILNLLRDENEIVAIAHPGWENGYPPEHLKYLTNYDLLEVLDNNSRSVPLWDSALSNGHPVFILSDDDAHNISNPFEIGRCCTFINAGKNNASSLIHSLKKGNAFGADIFMYNSESLDDKAINAKKIPVIKSYTVKHDTIRIGFSERAMGVRFIGQNGVIRKYVYYSDTAGYVFTPTDTYIRTEITFFTKDYHAGTKVYLNPVFRYETDPPTNVLSAEINWPRTWIFRLFSIPSLAFIIFLVIRYRYKKFKAIKERDDQ